MAHFHVGLDTHNNNTTRRQLLMLAAPLLQVEPETLQLRDGTVQASDGRSLSVSQIFMATFGAGAGAAVLGRGVFAPREIMGLDEVEEARMEAFSTLSGFHSFAAQGAEVVAVNLDTGKVKVLRLVAAHDVGRAINPHNCRQQVAGALGMGLGYALMEQYLSEDGRVLNPDFVSYLVPTALDCPPTMVFLVEKPHPQGPFGAKGVGEMALAPRASAIANAVFNACGVRTWSLPLTPAKILSGLRAGAC